MNTDFIILAAGKGTRMGSDLPKVLNLLGGKPLVQHLLDTVSDIKGSRLHLVVGHKPELVKSSLDTNKKTDFVLQKKQLGTGHAVKQTLKNLRSNSISLVLYGDGPLIKKQTLSKLISSAEKNNLSILTYKHKEPHGYGRIVRGRGGLVERIVEEKEASPEEKKIKEANSGILAIKTKYLKELVGKISNKNSAKEYYLTDIVELANKAGIPVKAITVSDHKQVLGVNNPQELHDLERLYQEDLARQLIAKGARLADMLRIDIRGDLVVGRGSFIDINAVFEGSNKLGKGVAVGPNCYIKNSTLGDGVTVLANTVIEDSIVGAGCALGPFSRIRGGTNMDTGSELGNFVEANRSQIGPDSKAKHLTYLGDAELGRKVNVGAGTITCNYDGENKNKTIMGDGAFIGSNSSLVAPVKLGKDSYTGAGSVITKTVKEGELAIGRGKQVNIKKKK
ncbi:bifunctional UDP-N-acetylglucosamine diphosphorylase/glucosamine-1-phosphate N-acetyltransferase GlmU [Gammaproteobacteria bacterium]|nr:bifunctional UDP-N-acetylglucosamine diphosphorylase/glucosamine-1-phosphate N-acetyltransferase GlmU [Gammaproteobacteria bacterium]